MYVYVRVCGSFLNIQANSKCLSERARKLCFIILSALMKSIHLQNE